MDLFFGNVIDVIACNGKGCMARTISGIKNFAVIQYYCNSGELLLILNSEELLLILRVAADTILQ